VRYLAPAQRNSGNARAVIAGIAAGQHGLITTAQVIAAGVSQSAISRRARRGELHRVHMGVYAAGHDALSREGRWLAGVLAGGPGAALCHLCAGKLWEVSRFRAPVVDVVVLRQHRSRPGLRFTVPAACTRAMSPATGGSRSPRSTACSSISAPFSPRTRWRT